jgi:hypothetical protein
VTTSLLFALVLAQAQPHPLPPLPRPQHTLPLPQTPVRVRPHGPVHAPTVWPAIDDDALTAVLATDVDVDLNARLVHASQPLVGAPYVLSPLGEGPGTAPDPDPRFRTDAFDCTTFVETALALAFSHDATEARRTLDVIRYVDGVPTFETRRHFPEAQWLPGLVQLGVLHEITREVGGDDVIVATKTLDATAWHIAMKRPGTPQLDDAHVPMGTTHLDVWPLAQALAHPERIPAGTVLNVVRTDVARAPVRISHQVLILDVNGTRVVRHAADRIYHHVVDEPLAHFLKRQRGYQDWPVVGFALFQVTRPTHALVTSSPKVEPTPAPATAR